MSDLQEVIVEATIRAFNAGYSQGKTEGYEAGIERALEAAKFVKFDHYDLEVIALSDFEEELKIREGASK
jgi:hypothetical protein